MNAWISSGADDSYMIVRDESTIRNHSRNKDNQADHGEAIKIDGIGPGLYIHIRYLYRIMSLNLNSTCTD